MATTTTGADVALIIAVGVLIIIWVVVAYFVARAAENKERSFWAFWCISLFVSPILGAVIVAALPASLKTNIAKGRLKACPRCAEGARPRALMCPHCGLSLTQRAVIERSM